MGQTWDVSQMQCFEVWSQGGAVGGGTFSEGYAIGASLGRNSWTPEPASLGKHTFHGVLSYNMQPSNNEASGQPDTSETGSQSQSFLLVGCLAPPSQWQKLTCCVSVILFPLQLLGNMQTGFAFSQEFSLTVIILLEIFCLTQEVRISYSWEYHSLFVK